MSIHHAGEHNAHLSGEFGAGLKRHIALHGEPPVCDVIVYPAMTAILAVMALAEPYTAADFGDEWLRIRYDVVADGPRNSCLFMQSDTEDYDEEGINRLLQRMPGFTR